MVKAETVEKVIAEIGKEAEAIDNRETKVWEVWEPGDVTAQGDLNIICLRTLPADAKARTNRQMAEGTTKGSRHMVIGGECYDASKTELRKQIRDLTGRDIDEKYIGPVFSGPCVLDHPAHANQDFRTECLNVATYQRVLDAELREQRVAD